MKLYSVFDLFVVQKDDVYFICKKDKKPNIYIEFFTKEKIEIDDLNKIDRLCAYYSLTDVTVYRSTKTKKQILLKYIELNNKVKNKELTKK